MHNKQTEEADLLDDALSAFGIHPEKSNAPTFERQRFVQNQSLTRIGTALEATKNGIICLRTALEIHGLEPLNSTPDVWIAISNKSRRPSKLPPYVRLAYFSNPSFDVGDVRREIEGIGEVRVFCLAKSIVDCFKYRNTLAAEDPRFDPIKILQRAIRSRRQDSRTTVEQIREFTEVCRMSKIMRPYLDALDYQRPKT